MVKKYSICQTCGKRIAYTECSEKKVLPEDPKCAVLKGWLTVSQWQGLETIDCYDFCSLTCLQKWVDERVPKIPQAFLKALESDP